MNSDNETTISDDTNLVTVSERRKKTKRSIKSQDGNQPRTFDEVAPEYHKEVSIKVIKHCLKSYFKLSSAMYPQSSVVRQEDSMNTYPGDIFSLKIDIDRAIGVLSLKLQKIIIMAFIEDIPVAKICSMLGYKFRVDFYRKLEEAFNAMYEELGPEWLRTNDRNYK